MDVKEKREERNKFGAIGKNIRESIRRDGIGVGSLGLWINMGSAALGFLFGGCHLLFGAYPLGVALVAALPASVWPALAGAVTGSLTLGRGGMIYAMICVLAVFLRIIISGGVSDKSNGNDTLFSEPLTLRISAAVIAGFVAAVYEFLLSGIGVASVLFGVTMIVGTAAFAAVFYGAFYHGIGVRGLILGQRRIFDRSGNSEENRRVLVFKASSAALVALVSLSLERYDLFGIDLSFVFSGCITLFAAKRFGPFYGGAVGFFSSFAVSGTFSAAYALLGIIAGALFDYGSRYALAAGGAALSLWGSYVSGVSGFLSLFPEYLISLCIITPMLRYFERENSPEEKETVEERATDMVGTMALSYRNRQQLACEKIEKSLSEMIPVISSFLPPDSTAEDYVSFLKLVGDNKAYTLDKREMDDELTEKLEDVMDKLGIRGSVIRAFGDRRKHVICAAEDRDGTLITSPMLKAEIEKASSLTFGTPKYYRRGNMALMECEAVSKYRIKAAYLTEKGTDAEVSGDSIGFFESDELYVCGAISDGMGSGRVAKRTSDFVIRFLKSAASSGASHTTVVHMINSILRRQSEECSSTLDLFSFDTVTGESEFIKSGAAVSYIKKGGSLYRIKSETIPLGLMKKVDAEKIKVSVAEGDTVVMLSDGICEPSDEAPWLVELLNRENCDVELTASKIIAAARVNNVHGDDMSVLVMRVERA